MSDDELSFEMNEWKQRKKTSFQSILNQKELTGEELEELFVNGPNTEEEKRAEMEAEEFDMDLAVADD